MACPLLLSSFPHDLSLASFVLSSPQKLGIKKWSSLFESHNAVVAHSGVNFALELGVEVKKEVR